MNAQTGHLCGDSFARLVHLEELGHDVARGLRTFVRSVKRDLRHRSLQHAGSHRVTLGMVAIQETFG